MQEVQIEVTTTTRLRPDVARVVALHVHNAPKRGGRREDCDAYESFKSELSATVGWDARPMFHDAGQYDAAVAAYLERVGM